MQLSQLLPGDLLIEDKVHTMIYVGQHQAIKYAMVDAYRVSGQDGVAIVDMEQITDRIWGGCHIFRREHIGIRTEAAEYAKRWAGTQIQTKMAPERRPQSARNIGANLDNRRMGVQLDLDRVKSGGADPEFGYDALYRVLKWATRRDAAFSEHRGTTCCSFAIACHQAASIYCHTTQHTVGRSSRINNAYEILKRNRRAKPPLTADSVGKTPSGKTISLGSTREFSNAGFKGTAEFGPEQAAAFMECWLGYLTDDDPMLTAEAVFTPALLLDAKYVHSSILQRRLQSNDLSRGWIACGQIEKVVGKLKMPVFQ